MRELRLYTFLFFSFFSFAHAQEHKVHENGMVYHDSTISHFRTIVDSITAVFDTVALNKIYYSKKQSKGYCFEFRGDTAEQINKDFEHRITFEDFKAKYLKGKELEEVVMHKVHLFDKFIILTKPSGEYFFPLSDMSYRSTAQDSLDYNKFIKDKLKGELCSNFIDYKALKQESTISIFYIIDDFENGPLKEDYARMIQYSYSLIDTNHTILFEDGELFKSNPSVERFYNYIESEIEQGKSEKEFAQTEEFEQLLAAAIKEGYDGGFKRRSYEYYVEKYHSAELALFFKRSVEFFLSCAADPADNVHYQEIFSLVTKTLNKDIFFRCHVNNMCPSYPDCAQFCFNNEDLNVHKYTSFEDFSPKIKELEAMNINVFDFFMGLILDVSNPVPNGIDACLHTLGSNLSRASDLDQIDARLFSVLEDEELDLNNRIRINYLFQIYNINVRDIDVDRFHQNEYRFDIFVSNLPKNLRGNFKKIY
ncbi:hypothetical protein [Flammeovirga aprica]|uniref:Uncharacterized protein n=1 Tax=Flammeovirga aprica JL-4 TaxID=694437 RepID=A0A7X9RQZ6_9BACT|nr:hypothetical protein [Flammeovirga aprica]NME67293.1 hypothetical protein [Flammeovirga aprica JL-4]